MIHHGLHFGSKALKGGHHEEELDQTDGILVFVMDQPQQIRFRDPAGQQHQVRRELDLVQNLLRLQAAVMLPELKARRGGVQQWCEVVSVLRLESLVVGIVSGACARAHRVDKFGHRIACPEPVELPLGSKAFQGGVGGVGESRCLVEKISDFIDRQMPRVQNLFRRTLWVT